MALLTIDNDAVTRAGTYCSQTSESNDSMLFLLGFTNKSGGETETRRTITITRIKLSIRVVLG